MKFSIQDISLVPQYGKLHSSTQAKLRPFIFPAPMDTVAGFDLCKAMLEQGELAMVCRYLPTDWERCLEELSLNQNCWFALPALKGMQPYYDLVRKHNVKINVAIDIAHGDSIVGKETIEWLRSQSWVNQIMSGSVCTWQGAQRNMLWGANIIRVGVGNGAACSTRVITGFGIPQASAIEEIANKTRAVIVADGGIQNSGDAAKYLALGAHYIMLGNKLSKTTESAGWYEKNGRLTKRYRGQASNEFMTEVLGKFSAAAEGASSQEFYPDSSVKDIIEHFKTGISRAISYAGVESLDELRGIPYVLNTESAYREGKPHV